MEASAVDWAWLAGIIEGEGCFSLSRTRRTGRGFIHYSPMLFVSNTDKQMTDECLRIAGRGFSQVYERSSYNKNWKQSYRVGWSSKRHLLYILPRILPYLRTDQKKNQAILLLEIAQRSNSYANRKEKTYEEIVWFEEAYAKLRLLKERKSTEIREIS